MIPPPPRKKKVFGHSDTEKSQERVKTALIAKDDPPRKVRVLDPGRVEGKIKRLLKFTSFEPERRYWLDTGSPEMNAAMGSEEKGLPYGKLFEIAGEEHGGKTALSLILAGIAQKDRAGIGYMDVEDSRDGKWSRRMGLDYSQVVKIVKTLMHRGKSKVPTMKTAEEMFAEMETGMMLIRKQGFRKQVWIVDSIAFLQPAMVVNAGVMGKNMRTNLERAMFLSDELPRLAGLAASYNAIVLLVNHLRSRPGKVFGDPLYSPGGHAMRHACSIRVRVRRHKNGELKKAGKTVGLVGVIKNIKNKAGGGSVQSAQAGFSIRWDRFPAKVTFMGRADLEDLL